MRSPTTRIKRLVEQDEKQVPSFVMHKRSLKNAFRSFLVSVYRFGILPVVRDFGVVVARTRAAGRSKAQAEASHPLLRHIFPGDLVHEVHMVPL